MNLLKEIEELSKYKLEYLDQIKELLEKKDDNKDYKKNAFNEISKKQINQDLDNLKFLKKQIEDKIVKLNKLTETLDTNEDLYKISLQLKEEFETLSLLITFLSSLIQKVELYKDYEVENIYKLLNELSLEIKNNEKQIKLLDEKLSKTVSILEKITELVENQRKQNERILGYYIHPLLYKLLEYSSMLFISWFLYSLFKNEIIKELAKFM